MTTIKCLLQESAYISQHEPGIIQGEKIILFSEWNRYASGVAARLESRGVKPGDRVSVFMANDWRMLVILTGIIRAGAVACPLSTRLPRAGAAERMAAIDSRWLVAYLAGDTADGLGDIQVLSPDALLDLDAGARRPVEEIPLDAPAMIVFTSGSSGEPKPAVLSYGNLFYNARGANVNLRLRSKDRWLLNLPLYHVGGIGVMFRCLLGGAAVLIPEMKETLIDSIIHYKPSFVSVVPAQLYDLAYDQDGEMISGVRAFLVGGDVLTAELGERCRELGWPLFPTYGMTETASQVATGAESDPVSTRLQSSGRVLRYRELEISDDGEILVRGPCLFSGYWKNGKPELPVDGNGWFHTGDTGSLDEAGYLHVTGRRDNCFISGGENIQPEEIERKLCALQGIRRAVVVPIADRKFGKRPVAFVDADELSPSSWCASLAAVLPGFMIPEAFYEMPVNETGDLKVSRSELAERAKRNSATDASVREEG